MNMINQTHPTHDPGGKVKLKLPDHVASDATFSTCGRYRQLLMRVWDSHLPHIMFVGMNPSTADHTHDDPTVRKECAYARKWGYGGLIKCNVMDYRVTSPKGLLAADVMPCSPDNLMKIQSQLNKVSKVVAAWGKLPPQLLTHAHKVQQLILTQHTQIWCLTVNKDGSPKHPLYVRMDQNLQLYQEQHS